MQQPVVYRFSEPSWSQPQFSQPLWLQQPLRQPSYRRNLTRSSKKSHLYNLFLGIVVITFFVIIINIILKSKSNDNTDSSKIVCGKDSTGNIICKCKPGVYGDFCENVNSDCTARSLCNYNGKPIIKNGECICQCYGDYTGEWCQKNRNEIYKVECQGMKICCKNGAMCGTRSPPGFRNTECEKNCLQALHSHDFDDDSDLMLSIENCICD